MKLAVPSRNIPFILIGLLLCGTFGVFFYQGHQANRDAAAKRRAALAASPGLKEGEQRLQKFKLTGFDERGKTAWNLEGDAAEIDPQRTVILEENVVLRLRGETTIKTDHVRWTQASGVLTTDSLVTVDHADARVVGRGAHGLPNEGFIQLHHDIVMNLHDGATRVACSGPLKIYYNQNKMVFYRKVVVTDDRGTLSANRMDVLFDPDDRKVKDIHAEGNVSIERNGDRTRSRRAIYSVRTGSVRLEGNPEITLTKSENGIIGDGLTGNPLAS